MPDPVPPTPDDVPTELESVPTPIDRIDLGASGRPEFEFTPAQERLMADLGGKMVVVGLIAMVAGVLMILDLGAEAVTSGSFRLSVLSLTPVLFLLVGVWTRQAGREYQLVASTHNRDITHLMGALEAQARVFRLAFWVFVAFVAFVLIGSIAARLMAASGPGVP